VLWYVTEECRRRTKQKRLINWLAFVVFIGAVLAATESNLLANFYAFQVTYGCDTWASYMCPEQLPAYFTASCDPGEGGFFCDDASAACEDFCDGSEFVDSMGCDSMSGYVSCNCILRMC